MALCIVVSEQYSNLPWKFMPPVKRLGQGRPMNESRAPSVPPRMGRTIGFTSASRIASSALSMSCGWGSTILRMLKYWSLSVSVSTSCPYFFLSRSTHAHM